MRLRSSLFSLACVGIVSLVGCGATGINPLPGTAKSVFEGSYGGSYQGIHNEAGAMTIVFATNGTFGGTIKDSITGKTGPLAGIVRQDGHFKAYYHYDNETTQYSGTGIMSQPVIITPPTNTTGTTTDTNRVIGFTGVWNLTTPNVTTLTFSVSGTAGTTQ